MFAIFVDIIKGKSVIVVKSFIFLQFWKIPRISYKCEQFYPIKTKNKFLSYASSTINYDIPYTNVKFYSIYSCPYYPNRIIFKTNIIKL